MVGVDAIDAFGAAIRILLILAYFTATAVFVYIGVFWEKEQPQRQRRQ